MDNEEPSALTLGWLLLLAKAQALVRATNITLLVRGSRDRNPEAT